MDLKKVLLLFGAAVTLLLFFWLDLGRFLTLEALKASL